ncbi:lysine histidine transporter-like 5 [Cucurbita moschata]|uniref:Lysine histidine transporter-like 5 n=1 Tax=Cucurbita moschata TaxID=3662 RepID=A0A6J1H697_CUCMO|nr:lysine histidine transporter-like 5 [Cucurbita moschata]
MDKKDPENNIQSHEEIHPDQATHSTTPPEEDKPHAQLNNWLPITASRKAKWWYSAFHNVTAMVGAGVLGLPFAVSQLGWAPGVTAIVLSWIITFYSLWQLVQLHEVAPGRRFDRYPELGMYAFGPKLGYWTIMPLQLTVQVASSIVYAVTGGKSLKKSCELVFPDTFDEIRETYFILFFTVLQLVMSQSPNFNSLKGVSLLAAIMSFAYSMVACVASFIKGNEDHHSLQVTYGVRSHTAPGQAFDALNGIGTIAFAFAGHSVVLEIQATIPSTEEKPSKVPMWRGVTVAYVIVAICYISVSISGYWAFGIAVDDDVLVSLENPKWLIAAANFMVFLHVIGSYQVFAMPVFDTIESALVGSYRFKPSRALRLIARSSYVALVGFVGMCIPFFGGLLGFFGGLVFAATSYFVPCIMWLIIKRPKPWSFHWIASWTATIIGVSIAVLTPIGGLRQIILSFKSYKIFS